MLESQAPNSFMYLQRSRIYGNRVKGPKTQFDTSRDTVLLFFQSNMGPLILYHFSFPVFQIFTAIIK